MQGGNENGLHGLQAFSTRIHREIQSNIFFISVPGWSL
uniref:Uncharacterized protein n=1 Tax=Populus trichocarpa TaxID=3694 RepID=A0A3N7FYD4_POPTR